MDSSLKSILIQGFLDRYKFFIFTFFLLQITPEKLEKFTANHATVKTTDQKDTDSVVVPVLFL